MKKHLITLILTLFTLFTFGQNLPKIDYAKPKEYEIGGVTISGIKYLDQNVLVHLSGLKVGNTVTVPGDDITKAINKLWKHGLFGDVEINATKIEGNKIFLDIYLKERPRLSSFTFNGIKKAQADDLRDEIKLIRGSQVTDDVLKTTKKKIQNYFIEKGFYNTEVNISQSQDSVMPNSVVLTIDVDKKDRIKIYEIYFEGNEVFSDAKLRRSMKDTKRKTWYNIFKASKYIETKYEDDKAKVIAKYNEKGYRDAEIALDSVYRNDDETLNLYMKINEGRQYFFRNVTWVGNTKYPSEYLDMSLGITKGDVFDQTVLDKRLFGDEDAVSALYLDRGYLFFSAVPVEVQVENDSIDLEIRIFEGKQARINRIFISGNTRTNDHVIRREIRTIPGELFSRSDIIRTNRELANLGYFDPEKLGVNPTPNPADGTVDIEYVVEERASDQIELSGGWGGGYVIGTLGLTFSNFSLRNIANFDTYSPLPTGDGQRLSIRAQTNGRHYQSYSLSFTEPWLGGKKPNSLSFSTYRSVYSPDARYIQGDFDDSRRISTTSVSLGLGRRLEWPDNYFTLYNAISYQRYNLKDYGIKYFYDGSSFNNGESNNINLVTVLARNSVDSPLYPRSGAEISLSLTITPPFSYFKKDDFWLMSEEEKESLLETYNQKYTEGPKTGEYVLNPEAITETERQALFIDEVNNTQYSDKYNWIEYHKWKFKSDWYTQIVNKLVLRTKIEFGYLGSFSSNLGDSPFESFELGGDGMQATNSFVGKDIVPLRGYDQGTTQAGYLTAYPQANVFNKYMLELRYPLTLNPSATIYALAFAEGGNSWHKINQFNPFDVHRSAGVGLRFWLPMFGLLGVDWGYGFDQPYGYDGDKYRFSFIIGQQF